MNKHNQQFIKGSIAVVIIAGTLAVLSLIASGFGETGGKLFAICYSLIFFGIFAAPCMVVSENPEYKALGTTGVVTALGGFFITSILILGELGGDEMMKFVLILFIASLGLAQICFLHHINVQNKYAKYARSAATVAISLFSFIIITQVFKPLYEIYSFGANPALLKLVLSSFIVNLAATLLVPLCNRILVAEPVQEFSFTEEQPAPEEKQSTEL